MGARGGDEARGDQDHRAVDQRGDQRRIRAPSAKNFREASGSPASMNCGRKVTKNRMIFGLVRLISTPGEIGLREAGARALARIQLQRRAVAQRAIGEPEQISAPAMRNAS